MLQTKGLKKKADMQKFEYKCFILTALRSAANTVQLIQTGIQLIQTNHRSILRENAL